MGQCWLACRRWFVVPQIQHLLANGLLEQFRKGKTVLGLILASLVISELECLNVYFQKRTETIAGMRTAVEIVQTSRKAKRDEEIFNTLFEEATAVVQSVGVKPIAIPQTRPPPKCFIEGAKAHQPNCAKDRYRADFFKVLDILFATVHILLRGGGKAPGRTLPPPLKRKEEEGERRSANMAAEESVNTNLVEVEKVVNRWIVDYYFSLAVEFFKTHQYADFCAARDILDTLIERPIESIDDMAIKVRVLQFLSRINEGEELDVQFDPEQSETPLESALNLLESMRTDLQIPQKDFDYASTLLKEMILGIFIKNRKFDKANNALILYFPKPGNCKRAIFMHLIDRGSNTHELIDQINFPRFKKEMLDFCQKLCLFTVPFLQKAAKTLLEQRIEVQQDGAGRIDEQDEPGPSSSLQINTVQFRSEMYPFIQKIRLAVTYKALAEGLEEKTFSAVEEEVEVEAQGNRDSCSPMEASPADQPPQTDAEPQAQSGSCSKTLYTVARLVVEPDSQPCSQCTTAAEEMETERTEKPPQTPSPSNKEENSLQCPVTDKEVVIPTRKLPRRCNRTVSRASTSFAEFSSDSEEESLHTTTNKELDGKLHEQSNKSLSKNSNKSRASSESDEEQQEHLDLFKTPVKRPHKQPSKGSPKCGPSSVEDICLTDSSLDCSPDVSSRHPIPQKSSTPHKAAQSKAGPSKEVKERAKRATEVKETWIDEDSFFPSVRNRVKRSSEKSISNSGATKRKWTESETEKLKEGVKMFGEGNWSKIKAYFCFKDRTNVNLKDRWRTMKHQNLV
ncbi:hypothetical protein CRENBAI_000028 [Crenichthys baileyi]|uniref:Telomeric repeat-binding factor 2 n=1 Tax=Crenichthys baileyi TaxID=28760 RepID=A0AAV9SSB8_9TELE